VKWHTGSEVDDEISKKDSVADAIENNPVSAEVVVEERNGNRERDHVGQKQDEHHQVPVQSAQCHAPSRHSYCQNETMSEKNNFYTFVPSDLDLRPFDLEITSHHSLVYGVTSA